MKKMPTVEVTEDLETILICAVRYACGRNTYMPGLVQDYIISNFRDKLSAGALKNIRDSINEIIKYEHYTDIERALSVLYQHDLMFGLRDWCETELEKRQDGDKNAT